MKLLIELTPAQRDALLDAANAMLAGEEGEGDAADVSFAVLERAVEALNNPVRPKPHGRKKA